MRARAAEKEAMELKKEKDKVEGERKVERDAWEVKNKLAEGRAMEEAKLKTDAQEKGERAQKRVIELEYEVEELKRSVGGGQEVVGRVKEGKTKEVRMVAVVDSFSAIEFISKEKKKGTIYAGDWENKTLIVIPAA